MQKNQPSCHCKAADNHIIFDCCHCEEDYPPFSSLRGALLTSLHRANGIQNSKFKIQNSKLNFLTYPIWLRAGMFLSLVSTSLHRAVGEDWSL